MSLQKWRTRQVLLSSNFLGGAFALFSRPHRGYFVCTSCPSVGHLQPYENKMSKARQLSGEWIDRSANKAWYWKNEHREKKINIDHFPIRGSIFFVLTQRWTLSYLTPRFQNRESDQPKELTYASSLPGVSGESAISTWEKKIEVERSPPRPRDSRRPTRSRFYPSLSRTWSLWLLWT